ncbi:MAG: hypothetical protein ACYCY5_04925, partial [Sulfuricella sp.]
AKQAAIQAAVERAKAKKAEAAAAALSPSPQDSPHPHPNLPLEGEGTLSPSGSELKRGLAAPENNTEPS